MSASAETQAKPPASKAGILRPANAAAKEPASKGITVNAVAPGMIDTDMTYALPESVQASIWETIPIGRIGAPEDVARAVVFSADPGYLTGQVLCVDGGMAV